MIMLDVGANVGDTALQVLNACNARILCVEADPYWVRFLRRNVGDDERIRVKETFLTVDELTKLDVAPKRSKGTTRFVIGGAAAVSQAISPVSLKEEFPEFSKLRLVKCDTDGFDTSLVPAIASAWLDSAPVLFFECDYILARESNDSDPEAVWRRLASLGYMQVAVWDNFGNPLGRLAIDSVAVVADALNHPKDFGYHYWDVAVVHESDADGRNVLNDFMPALFR